MRKDVGYSRGIAVDAGNAVDWDHPLNQGRIGWWHAAPGVSSGGRLVDLCGKYSSAVTNGKWTNVGGNLQALQFTGSATSQVLVSNFQTFTRAAIGLTFNLSSTSSRGVACKYGGQAGNDNGVAIGVGSTDTDTAGNNLLILREAQAFVNVKSSLGTGTFRVFLWSSNLLSLIGGTIDVYLNGQFLSNITGVNSPSASISFGGYPGSSTRWWNGGPIGDCSFWGNQKLSSQQMATLDYQQSVANYRTPDSPLRWFSTRSYSLPAGGGTNLFRKALTNRIGSRGVQ